MHKIAEKARARRAHRRYPAASLDRRPEGNPGFKSSLPVTHLVGEHRREGMLPRLLLALAERDDFRAMNATFESGENMASQTFTATMSHVTTMRRDLATTRIGVDCHRRTSSCAYSWSG